MGDSSRRSTFDVYRLSTIMLAPAIVRNVPKICQPSTFPSTKYFGKKDPSHMLTNSKPTVCRFLTAFGSPGFGASVTAKKVVIFPTKPMVRPKIKIATIGP